MPLLSGRFQYFAVVAVVAVVVAVVVPGPLQTSCGTESTSTEVS